MYGQGGVNRHIKGEKAYNEGSQAISYRWINQLRTCNYLFRHQRDLLRDLVKGDQNNYVYVI